MKNTIRHRAGSVVAGRRTGGQFKAHDRALALAPSHTQVARVAADLQPQLLDADYEAGKRSYQAYLERKGQTINHEIWVDEQLGRAGHLTQDEWRYALYRGWQYRPSDPKVPSVSAAYPALASFLDHGTADAEQLKEDLTRMIADRGSSPTHRPFVQIAERYLEYGEQ